MPTEHCQGRFSISTAGNDQILSSIAYNSSTSQYLVVWQDHSGATWDIYGQLVNANGSLSGVNFFISMTPDFQGNVSVAYSSSSTQYLVVWGDDRGADRDIYGQFVNANGSLSGGDFPVSAAANNQIEPLWPLTAIPTNTSLYGRIFETVLSGTSLASI